MHLLGELIDINLELASGPCEQVVCILAHEGFLVVAGDIVPFDAILVDVVEDTHARLAGLVNIELCVVGLGASGVSLAAPWLGSPSRRGGVGVGHLGVGTRPEPTLHLDGLQVLALVTPSEVAQTTRRPDVVEATVSNKVDDHGILFLALHTDCVHTPPAALVTSLQPIHLAALAILLEVGAILVPREEIVMVAKLPILRTGATQLWFREGQ